MFSTVSIVTWVVKHSVQIFLDIGANETKPPNESRKNLKEHSNPEIFAGNSGGRSFYSLTVIAK
jgi:hypothetical protein